MHTMPELVPGPTGCGEALTFPKGRESVASRGGLSLADYTVAFWFKSPRGTAGICIAGPEFALKEGTLVANHGGWPSSQSAGANLADGQWHHVAFAWTQADASNNFTSTACWWRPIPARRAAATRRRQSWPANTGGAFLGGCLDEFRIYARCLSAADVPALAKMVAPGAS